MKYYFAPMEGLTGYLYRNAHHAFYPDVDCYFTPFLAPNQKKCFRTRERNDVLPENNLHTTVVPQILTNKAEEFIRAAEELKAYGYQEVNLNLGCPSKTVVSKYKGSGFLAVPEELDRFLDGIFQKTDIEISLKTRIGKDSPVEFPKLVRIYNKYPLKELIVHPRIQRDFYKNTPNLEAFGEGLALCECPVCYNGDINSAEDERRIRERFPQVERIMIGRGLLANPALIGEIRGKTSLEKQKLWEFHNRIYEEYQKLLYGEKNVLFKMKELWSYLHRSFEDSEKYAKKIRKAEKLSGYETAVKALFAEREIAGPSPKSWVERGLRQVYPS